MKIAGAIMTLVLSIFGSLLMLGDLFTGKGGAALAALLGLSLLSVQFILAIVGFFRARGAGMAIIVTGGIMVVFSVIARGWFTGGVEILVVASGILLYLGGKKDETQN